MKYSLRAFAAALAGLLLAGGGCSQLYYASMEKLGKEKRDILIKRIVAGKKDQEEAREQIKTTMEAFQELTGFSGGNLEKVYNKLNSEYESAKGRADDVTERIHSIDQVANDLFREWDREISQMRDAGFKARSRTMLREAQVRHRRYIGSMRATRQKMQPVLDAFRDQVLFLKHNLNARAIQSLKQTAAKLDRDVASLVADMDLSMKESDQFVKALMEGDAAE